MKTKDAETLIEKAFDAEDRTECWADLGCGSGTFTYALANCLKAGSTIYAVDKEMPVLTPTNNVNIQCIRADMETIIFRNSELDRILMGNSFHYVKDKNSLMQRLRPFLKSDGRFLIVEYDTDKANKWVPFPITFQELLLLFKNNGFNKVEKIGERSSIFGPQKMYACVALI
jgi:ubiquinone/menaquinone biosynthesis C-methylase UbiE